MIYLNNDSIHFQTVFIPRQSYQSGTTRNPDYGTGLTPGDVYNIIADSPAFSSVEYDSTDKKIYFYNGDGEKLTPEIDCTDFIKDGMVNEVYIENNNLVIVFNTDAGKEDIVIPLTDIFNPDDYYTKQQTDTAISEATSGLQETLVSGENIKTVNNQSILGSGDIHIDGASYSAGTNIEITEENVINVTGITVPTKTSDLTNDSGFVDSGDVQTQIESAITDMATTGDLATLKTEIEAEIPDVSDFVTSGDVATQIDSALTDYSTTEQVNQAIASAKTEIEAEIPDVSDFVTSADVQTQIESALTDYATTGDLADLKTEIEAEIPDVSDFVTSADVENRISGFEETTSKALNTLNTDKQETLVSGENIKTVNNQSLLGSGNIEISAGTEYSAGTNIDITNNVISVTGITVPTKTSDLTNDSGFVDSGDVATQIESALTDYPTTQEMESAISSARSEIEAEIPDVSDFVTSADVETQITGKGYVTSGDVQTQIESAVTDMATTGDLATLKTEIEAEIPDVSDFVTSGDVENIVEERIGGFEETTARALNTLNTNQENLENRVDGFEETTSRALNNLNDNKQETLVSGESIKTINNQSLLGEGNIEISGGSGGANVIELTKAEYEALTSYTEDAIYVITDADTVDIDDFATTGDVATLQTTVSGLSSTKADKANVSASSGRRFPAWNSQGIITGATGNTAYEQSLNINGTSKTMIQATNSSFGTIYAPTSAGTAGQVLTSNGSGAPGWTAFKFWFGTQAQYDAITTKDSNTIYFITD